MTDQVLVSRLSASDFSGLIGGLSRVGNTRKWGVAGVPDGLPEHAAHHDRNALAGANRRYDNTYRVGILQAIDNWQTYAGKRKNKDRATAEAQRRNGPLSDGYVHEPGRDGCRNAGANSRPLQRKSWRIGSRRCHAPPDASEQIKVVQAGGRPIANVYGAEPEMTDLRQWMGGYLPMSCQPDPTFHQTREFKDIFDDTHKEYEIPASSSVMR